MSIAKYRKTVSNSIILYKIKVSKWYIVIKLDLICIKFSAVKFKKSLEPLLRESSYTLNEGCRPCQKVLPPAQNEIVINVCLSLRCES